MCKLTGDYIKRIAKENDIADIEEFKNFLFNKCHYQKKIEVCIERYKNLIELDGYIK